MAKIQKELDSLTIQPIAEDGTKSNRAEPDQDTALPTGFISKLRERETERGTKNGILSPREAQRLYVERGASMFADPEDREIIDALLGTGENPTIDSSIIFKQSGLKLGEGEERSPESRRGSVFERRESVERDVQKHEEIVHTSSASRDMSFVDEFGVRSHRDISKDEQHEDDYEDNNDDKGNNSVDE
jgi:hypothetical protein